MVFKAPDKICLFMSRWSLPEWWRKFKKPYYLEKITWANKLIVQIYSLMSRWSPPGWWRIPSSWRKPLILSKRFHRQDLFTYVKVVTSEKAEKPEDPWKSLLTFDKQFDSQGLFTYVKVITSRNAAKPEDLEIITTDWQSRFIFFTFVKMVTFRMVENPEIRKKPLTSVNFLKNLDHHPSEALCCLYTQTLSEQCKLVYMDSLWNPNIPMNEIILNMMQKPSL